MSICGVDVGGTFTDVVLFDDRTGEVTVAKIRSSHPTPDVAVLDGIVGIDDGAQVGELTYFVHGNTVGLNALIEGRGPRMAILATEGFKDVLEIRRSNQTEDPYNLFWRPPPPLIPRSLRFGIGERISHTGEVVRPVPAEDVEIALAACRKAEVEGIVIALINAYANPDHEREVAELLRRGGFDGDITLSHQISREYREYERTSTAVVNGFIRPHVSAYLERLEDGLSSKGFTGQSLVTRSGGGALSFEEGQRRPFETLLSGPVAGVEGACYLGGLAGFDRVITADVGGTSFDTAFILDGRPRVKNQGEIIGMPVQTPWVDVRSIGAGGGSIAHIGAGGLLHVGPKSAGADPGPAAYGNGGTEPTVTDAATVLGMLPVSDLSGSVGLDPDLARGALAPLGEKLGLGVDELSSGIIKIATTSMADAIREITVESGEDPRTAILVAYGGAGPLFATPLAAELDIAEVVIPPHAGVFSAWGLMVTDAVQVRSRTRPLPLSDDSLTEVSRDLLEMLVEIEADVEGHDANRQHPDEATHRRMAQIDLRYVGQEHTLTVPVEMGPDGVLADAESLTAAFEEQYYRRFDITLEAKVEIVVSRVELRRALAAELERIVDARPSGDAVVGRYTARAYSFAVNDWRDFEVLSRGDLTSDSAIEGPAIIVEGTTTTYVDHGFTAKLGQAASIRITRQGER